MSPIWLLVFIPLFILGLWGLFKALFSAKSTEKIISANEANKHKYYMKKYPEVDVMRFGSVFRSAGLLVTLSFLLLAFNWAPKAAEVLDLGEVFIPEEIEQLPPPSAQKPPPPPPPPPPPKLEVVEDEEVLEDEPEIMEQEVEEETEVEIPEEVVEEVEEVMEVEEVEEVVEEPEIFTIVEDMPEFPGGQAELFKFIGQNIKYPPMARENGIEGTVYVGFVVMEDGSIKNVSIKRGLSGGGAGCNDEAVRVVNMLPKWKPGKQRGKAVRVAYTLPIKFKLQ